MALAFLSAAASVLCVGRGYNLYDGDAEAHLDIARRVLDSRTPGIDQIGTVWLPLPHLLMLPLVQSDALWKSGVAGTIPSGISFMLAGTFLFAAAKRAFGSPWAGVTSALLFALNANLLYLQSSPMTEPLMLAAMAALLWATLWFRDSQSVWAIVAAAAASNAASLTRYDGWFAIPFVCLYLLIVARKKSHAVLFGALASLGPLAWLAFNQYWYSNPLEFYNGPYSALALYRKQLAQGVPYPADHNWRKSIEYYFAASKMVAGPLLLIAGAAGALIAGARKICWPVLFLAITPVFYIWSMHSSGVNMYVPGMFPFSSYNTRYAVAVIPLAAFAAGALVYRRALVAALVVLFGCGAFLPGAYSSAVWREARVNSAARRAVTAQAARFLEPQYQTGTGVLCSFSDLVGVFREAGIPLREALHEGNHPQWDRVTARPELALREQWVMTLDGDPVAQIMARSRNLGLPYELKKEIMVEGSPVLQIYRRTP